MNICSEHHEIKRKIRIIILRIIDIYLFTHSKICFVCISKVICTVHVTSVNIKFISEDLDWELQKDIFRQPKYQYYTCIWNTIRNFDLFERSSKIYPRFLVSE